MTPHPGGAKSEGGWKEEAVAMYRCTAQGRPTPPSAPVFDECHLGIVSRRHDEGRP